MAVEHRFVGVVSLLTLLPIAFGCIGVAQAADAPPGAPKIIGQDLFGGVARPEQADPRTLPRTKDGKPDFTGVYLAGMGAGIGPGGGPPRGGPPRGPAGGPPGGAPPGGGPPGFGPPQLPLTPPYAVKARQWDQAAQAGHPYADSVSLCEAFGMPRVMGIGYIEFLTTPGKQVTIITEILHEVRRVYLDGRPHPADLEPTFDGHSIGHWEGDTLVIDTVGIKANNLEGNAWHSDKLHITERISMPNRNGLIDEITMVDPEALTKPVTEERYYRRVPARQEIEEYVCTNQRNAPDAKGFQTAE